MPKLSCLLVTKDRLARAKKAIQCFENQTLADSELVIVDESEDGLAAYVQTLTNPRIRFIRPENENLSLGELRNLSVQEAQGDIVVQWDDDDWYHPDRLKRQWNAMHYTGSVACFLQRWTLAWPARDLFALSKRRYWEGSIMIKKEFIPAYTPKPYGEDSDMVRDLIRRNLPIALLDAPELYIYIVHGKNTYPESHFVHNIFNETTGLLNQSEVETIKNQILNDRH